MCTKEEFSLRYFWFNYNSDVRITYEKEDGSFIEATILSREYKEDEYHKKEHFIGSFVARFVKSELTYRRGTVIPTYAYRHFHKK